jgi:hypothetical protein
VEGLEGPAAAGGDVDADVSDGETSFDGLIRRNTYPVTAIRMIICATTEEVAVRAMTRTRGGREEMIRPRGLRL